jgi:succinate dehydrogenase / fumarate reductase membrane anchor subunit
MSAPKTSLRTPMARVRGLGSARKGTHHFVVQRVTAIALVPLVIWFVWAIAAHAGATYTASAAFLAHPVNATLMLLLVLTGIYHLMLGLQVVIEDYTAAATRVTLLLLNTFGCAVLALACTIAILKLAL